MHRTDSIYDDRPELQYQFPKPYLSRASQFVGDWIIYYEPRRGPTAKGYYAIARVERIVPDPTADGMYLALIEPGSYLPFERGVPFSGADGPVEPPFGQDGRPDDAMSALPPDLKETRRCSATALPAFWPRSPCSAR